LAQERKVIPVRLALFAEMVKGRPWTPATLREVGGAGVGLTFLEETFSAAAAPPEHRYHQEAARAVLKALLPESGSDIRGSLRSDAELLAASGYAGRPREFDDLLRILDGELRLITPTDPEGVHAEAPPEKPAPAGRYYQLTHDYLVHPLRDWLTRKQKGRRRGRAELRLAEWAALWHGKPENRHLPSWREWAGIRLHTRRRDWTPPQREMMRRAGHYHALRGAMLGLLLALLALGVWAFGALRAPALVDTLLAARARELVDTLLDARTADVPGLVHELGPYRRWADPLLREKAAREGLDEGKRLHVALAPLPVDAGWADYLGDRLLTAQGPEEVRAVRTALRAYAPATAARFWPVLLGDEGLKPRRLRAACALALSDAGDPRWANVGDEVVACLAGENLLLLREWAELLEPVRAHLVGHQARRLAGADAGGFAAFLALLRAYPEEAPAALHEQLDRPVPATARQEERPITRACRATACRGKRNGSTPAGRGR
jgi:hypothetical protein